jgi:hypothetical protein
MRSLITCVAALLAAATPSAPGGGAAQGRDCLQTGSFSLGPIRLGMPQAQVRASLRAPTATRREGGLIVLSYRGIDVGVADASDKVALLRAVGTFRGTPNNVRIGQTRRQARAIMPRDALPEAGPDSVTIPSCRAGEGTMTLVFDGGRLRKLELAGPGPAR